MVQIGVSFTILLCYEMMSKGKTYRVKIIKHVVVFICHLNLVILTDTCQFIKFTQCVSKMTKTESSSFPFRTIGIPLFV